MHIMTTSCLQKKITILREDSLLAILLKLLTQKLFINDLFTIFFHAGVISHL